MKEKVLTIGSGEVARMLGINRKTVVNYVKNGKIPAQRLPTGIYRYNRETIEELADYWNNERKIKSENSNNE